MTGPRKITPEQIGQAQQMREIRDEDGLPVHSVTRIAALFGVCRNTIRRYTEDPDGRGVRVFTDEEITMIRTLCAEKNPDGTKKHTQRELAHQLGVCEVTIWRIVHGKIYREAGGT